MKKRRREKKRKRRRMKRSKEECGNDVSPFFNLKKNLSCISGDLSERRKGERKRRMRRSQERSVSLLLYRVWVNK